MSYEESALKFIRQHGENASYDDWRNGYSIVCDAVELFTAWTDAMVEFLDKGFFG